MIEDTLNVDLPNIPRPDQFDLCKVTVAIDFFVEINRFSSEQTYSFETTGPRSPMSDFWTPGVNNTRHN